jgi:hypothetical protein
MLAGCTGVWGSHQAATLRSLLWLYQRSGKRARIRQYFPSETDLFGRPCPKPSQGSVPGDLTLVGDLAFVFNASRVRLACCVDPTYWMVLHRPVEPARLIRHLQLPLSRESTQTVMTMDLCRGSDLPNRVRIA